jgi:ATP-dependent protease ClpP protease subunit
MSWRRASSPRCVTNNWMSPEEAVDYGLVSRIIRNRSELG